MQTVVDAGFVGTVAESPNYVLELGKNIVPFTSRKLSQARVELLGVLFLVDQGL